MNRVTSQPSGSRKATTSGPDADRRGGPRRLVLDPAVDPEQVGPLPGDPEDVDAVGPRHLHVVVRDPAAENLPPRRRRRARRARRRSRSSGSRPHPLARRVEERLGGHLRRRPSRRRSRPRPRADVVLGRAGRRTRSSARPCSRSRRSSPGRRAASPTRTGSDPSATARGSSSDEAAQHVARARCAASSASRPTNSPLSSFTAKPRPASNGVSSGVMSAPQTR